MSRAAMRSTAIATLALAILSAPAFAQGLVYPLDVAVGDAKTIYLVDRQLPGVWKSTDGVLSPLFKAGKKFRTRLNAVRCIASDGKGALLVGDTGMREVFRLTADGKLTPLTNPKTGELVEDGKKKFTVLGQIGIPMGIAVDKAGMIHVADLELQRIWQVPAAGGEPKEFAVLPAPRGMTFGKDGRLWVVSGGPKNQLVTITPDGKITPVVTDRVFRYPHDVALDDAGNAYVSDGYADCIWKIAPGGKPAKWVTDKQLDNPVGLDFQGPNLLVVDSRARQVFQVTPDGKLTVVSLKAK